MGCVTNHHRAGSLNVERTQQIKQHPRMGFGMSFVCGSRFSKESAPTGLFEHAIQAQPRLPGGNRHRYPKTLQSLKHGYNALKGTKRWFAMKVMVAISIDERRYVLLRQIGYGVFKTIA
jgi:hypothetical protein